MFPKVFELERYYKGFGCPCDTCANQYKCDLYKTTPVCQLPQIKFCCNYLKNGGVMTKAKMEKQETLKEKIKEIDTRYIIDGYKIIKCINVDDYFDPFSGKIKVGLNPKERDGVLCCEKTIYARFTDVYRTVEEAERAVVDKKIEDLRRELQLEKEFTGKISKIVYIGFFALAGLNLFELLIRFIAK